MFFLELHTDAGPRCPSQELIDSLPLFEFGAEDAQQARHPTVPGPQWSTQTTVGVRIIVGLTNVVVGYPSKNVSQEVG